MQNRVFEGTWDEVSKRAAILSGSTRVRLEVVNAGHSEVDYSDEQFATDLRKASKTLDRMAAEALKAHAEGKTRRFPK